MKSHITDLSLFVDWMKNKKRLSESTIFVYGKSVERFLIINPDIDVLDDYNEFLVEMTHKKRCSHYYSALKAFVEFKISDAPTKRRLLEGLIRPPERNNIVRERRHLTEDIIFQVINCLDKPKHKIIALIQSLSGVRAADILRLKRDNIVPEEYKGKPVLKFNILGKGQKRNVIFIHDKVAQHIILNYITKNINFEDYYFLELGKMKGRQGNIGSENMMIKMNYLWYWSDLKQALNTVGIDRKDFATHDFRRCFARRVWEKYSDIHVLQSMLNHADPRVTIKYLAQSGLKNIDHSFEMQK
jgi:integrase